MFRNKKRKRCP